MIFRAKTGKISQTVKFTWRINAKKRLPTDDKLSVKYPLKKSVKKPEKSRKTSSENANCQTGVITLDAKRNEKRELDSIHFYKRLGFKILKERIKGTTPMYLDLKLP